MFASFLHKSNTPTNKRLRREINAVFKIYVKLSGKCYEEIKEQSHDFASYLKNDYSKSKSPYCIFYPFVSISCRKHFPYSWLNLKFYLDIYEARLYCVVKRTCSKRHLSIALMLLFFSHFSPVLGSGWT